MDVSTFYPAIVVILLVGIVLMAIRIKTGASPRGVTLIAVSIIILGSVTVPILMGHDEKPEDFQTISYDDYLMIGNDFTDATGSLEIVEIQGKRYLHANNIGEGSYTKSGTTSTVTVSKSILDVFAILGQSNAAHELFNRSTSTEISPGCGYYFGTDTQVFQWSSGYSLDGIGLHDMRGDEYYQIASNVDAPFASKYNELTGHKVLVVNCGIGGTASSTWVPNASSWNYAKNVFNTAMGEIDGDLFEVHVKDFIWIQGEGDSGTSVTTYVNRFISIFDSMTNPESETPFSEYIFENAIISKVREANGVNSSKAQLKLPAQSDKIHIATKLADTFTINNGLMLGDNLHYSQFGDNLIGEALAQYVADLHP